MKKSILLLSIIFISFSKLFASHAMGGELTYTYLGNNQYEVTLKFYRDCAGISSPTSASIQLVNTCLNTTTNLTLSLQTNIPCQNGGVSGTSGCEVSQVCNLSQTQCANPNNPLPGSQLSVFKGIVTLPTSCNRWFLKYNLCCRNPSTNMPNTASQDISLESMINNTNDPMTGLPYVNNSPKFFNDPLIFACVNSPTQYSHAAVESDGDSLVYKLVNPLGTNYNPILTYNPGYSLNQPIRTSPANSLTFDSISGVLNFRPANQETDVIAVRIEEYRNGVLIGYVLRDIQLKMIPCTNFIPQFETQLSNVVNATYSAPNELTVCPNANFSFDLNCYDISGANLSLFTSLSGGNTTMNGAQVSTQNMGIAPNDSIRLYFSWTPSDTQAGTHYLILKLKNDQCPVNGEAYRVLRINVDNKTTINVDTAYYCGAPVSLNVNGGTNGIWSPSSGVSNVLASEITAIPPISPFIYAYTSDCGADSVVIFSKTPLVSTFTSDSVLCRNDTLLLSATFNTNDHPNAVVSWSPSSFLFDPISNSPISTGQTVKAIPTSSIDYVATVSSGYGCDNKDTISIILKNNKYATFITSDIDSQCPGVPVKLIAKTYSSSSCGGVIDTSCNGIKRQVQVGNATTIQGGGGSVYPSIYGNYRKSARHQILIKAQELNALLGQTGGKITSISTFIGTLNSNNSLQDFSIKLKCVKMDSILNFVNSGLITVFNPKLVTPILGTNRHLLDVAYDWDGESDLLIDFCFNSNFNGTINNKNVFTTTPFRSVISSSDNTFNTCGSPAISGIQSTAFFYQRPNILFDFCIGLTNIPVPYQWMPDIGANAPLNTNGDTAFIKPISTQLYSVTGIDSFGCSTNASKTIFVDSFSADCYDKNIFGKTTSYIGTNCIVDSLSPGHPVKNLKMNLYRGASLVGQRYTNNQGNFSMKAINTGMHTLAIDTIGIPIKVECPTSFSRTIDHSSVSQVHFNQNFSVSCDSSFDLGVHSIRISGFRANTLANVNIVTGDLLRQVYGLNCLQGMAGTVTTIISGPSNYASPAVYALTPTVVNGDTLIYQIPNFSTLPPGAFDIIIQHLTAPPNAQICVKTFLNSTNDLNPLNDTLMSCGVLLNSYDPNNKLVSPTAIEEGGEWLYYTINFQNTGNDTAYNVVIKDTLLGFTDPSTFQYLASSHSPEIEINNNVVDFVFNDIYLVDSATNPVGSQGWVLFKIKSTKLLPPNFEIKNRAAIYFDSNPAIITDYAVTTQKIQDGVGINDLGFDNQIQLFPNPTSASVTVFSSRDEELSLVVSDISGRFIQKQSFLNSVFLDLSAYESGIYTISIINQSGHKSVKRVVKF